MVVSSRELEPPLLITLCACCVAHTKQQPTNNISTAMELPLLDGEREQLLHALYHVQKKHATASGVLIPHHNINALVLIRIGDYEQFSYLLFFTKVTRNVFTYYGI